MTPAWVERGYWALLSKINAGPSGGSACASVPGFSAALLLTNLDPMAWAADLLHSFSSFLTSKSSKHEYIRVRRARTGCDQSADPLAFFL